MGHRWSWILFSMLLSGGLWLGGCGGSDDVCRPNCGTAECGDDGCGGSCGTCADELSCTEDRCVKGSCVFQVDPNFCTVAGSCVPSGTEQPDNPCKTCQPSSSSVGWTARGDGIACGGEAFCYGGECCDTTVNCAERNCGDDGCGGVCGTCTEFETCRDGVCKTTPCDPKCDNKDCGPDGCGDICGTCPNGYECDDNGFCQCVRLCAGKECGDDGCGGVCGSCTGINVVCQSGACVCAGEECNGACCGPNQVCVNSDFCCKPACEVAECGPDGCGGSCGDCPGDNMECVDGGCECPGVVCPVGCCSPGQECDLSGACCTPQCSGKECGPNGCGSLCGLCLEGQLCLTGVCPPEGDVCLDDNEVDWDGCTQGQLSEFQVNTEENDWQYNPAVAPTASGRFVVAWDSRDQDATGEGVFGQIFSQTGMPAGPEFRANTYMTDDQLDAAVTGFANGAFVVAWDSFEQDGSDRGVYFQLYSADGAKTLPETRVNEFTTLGQLRPALATLAGGDFVVVWEGVMGNGTGGFLWDEVFCRVYDASGAPLTDVVRVNATTLNEQTVASVTATTDGGFVVVWQSLLQDGNGLGVYAQRFDEEAMTVGSEILVNTYTPGDQKLPDVAPLPDGGFVVVWETTSQDAEGSGIMMRLFDGDDVPVTAELLVNTTTQGGQQTPAVASFSDGEFVVAWESREQDGSLGGIYFQRFDENGTKLGVETAANVFTSSNQQSPDVATLPGDTFVMVWRSWGQEGDVQDQSYGVFARRFDKDGEAIYH